MNIAYLIIAYHQENHLADMIRLLADEHAFFFIHIDKKSDIEPFRKAIRSPQCFFTEKRVTINWGGWSMVEATLNLIRAALDHDAQFKYYQLLSDSCFPIKSRTHIYNRLLNSNANFITINEEVNRRSIYFDWISEYHSHDVFDRKDSGMIKFFRGIRVHIRKALQKNPCGDVGISDGARYRPPAGDRIRHLITFVRENGAVLVNKKFKGKPHEDMKPYKGWQWWCLTDDCIKYIMAFIKENPRFVRFYKVTHIPDEMFFHTIIRNSTFSESIVPGMGHGRITGNHYIPWEGGIPVILDENHYQELIACDACFARKFCEVRSALLIKRLKETFYGI